jgi:hypothetical protein
MQGRARKVHLPKMCIEEYRKEMKFLRPFGVGAIKGCCWTLSMTAPQVR